ncbi:tryptophan-rich sensory protein [Phycicoccus sp. CSK15P-2]|uniref:TspO/MBR family protein n=1 Tax=Phycicoccus sp. CSK15P-2 TaxID=2807627 RepID=UPI00195188C6|nr:TspO/MBR family protein [Phycicoccus sp. CSK15P-2]MBM6405406.1 tryptophan-rich sensory protein [Phycicoccus sp. CSK15P-2]
MRAAATVAVLALVAAYAGLSGTWVGADPGWYADLEKPAWQPPPVVFGVMWPLNFLALAVACGAVAWTTPVREAWPVLGVLGASVVLALGWAYLFYVPHALGPAAAALAGAAVLTWVLVVLAGQQLTWAGWALVPYAAWMTVATSLAVGYWALAGPA